MVPNGPALVPNRTGGYIVGSPDAFPFRWSTGTITTGDTLSFALFLRLANDLSAVRRDESEGYSEFLGFLRCACPKSAISKQLSSCQAIRATAAPVRPLIHVFVVLRNSHSASVRDSDSHANGEAASPHNAKELVASGRSPATPDPNHLQQPATPISPPDRTRLPRRAQLPPTPQPPAEHPPRASTNPPR